MTKRRGAIILTILCSVLLTLGTLTVIMFAGPTANGAQGVTSTLTVTPATTATAWTDPQAAAHAAFTPVRLIVPAMHLDAKVIPVGTTPEGAMSTPHCASATDPLCGEVYWYSPGVVPGQIGNAVIAGHVNRPDASPASFGALTNLVAGDTFQVQTADNHMLTFKVTSVERVTAYAKGQNNPIINEIFGPAAQPDLNLITCIGDWDGATFNQRLVVHTQIVGTSPYPNH
jgi:hypothetical protein